MPDVIRYFSTAAAGAGDGTSWANRAALLNAEGTAWSPIITGFNFGSGQPNLIAYIGPGDYTINATLQSSSFTVAPPISVNVVNYPRLLLVGCDSSGNRVVPPDPAWNCCDAAFNYSSFPKLTFINNTRLKQNGVHLYGLYIYTSQITSGNGLVEDFSGTAAWCVFENQSNYSSMATLSASSSGSIYNSVLIASGPQFGQVAHLSHLYDNIKIIANPNAIPAADVTGTNTGSVSCGLFLSSFTYAWAGRACITGCPGAGIYHFFGGGSSNHAYGNLTIDNCGYGIRLGLTTGTFTLINSYISNSKFAATRIESSNLTIFNCRFRDNPVIHAAGNYHPLDQYAEPGSDESEFVNKAANDYRIKNTSVYWNRKLGAGDQAANESSNLRGGFSN